MPSQEVQGGKGPKVPKREAFSKESHIMKVARQVYQRTHQAIFERKGQTTSPVFCQMATWTNPLNVKVYQVQETWGDQKNLRTANPVARTPLKDIHFLGSSPQWNCQWAWASRASISWRSCDSEAAWLSAPAAAKRIRMRGQWWITCRPCTTT